MLGFQTLSCLHDIPVVRSSTDKIQDVYAKAKDTSALIRVPCNLAETIADKSLRFALTVANPIVKPLSGPVRVIDDFAAQKLRQIESKYPVINTPMEDVVNSFNEKTEPVRHVMSSVKDTTATTIQHGKETVSNVATATVNKATNVADSVFSFCESHVPGIQRLHYDKTQRPGERLLTNLGLLFNRMFHSVEITFIWFRMLLVFSLLKTKQMNDMIISKIHRKPMLRQHPQRLLIMLGTFLEYLIGRIKPDDRTLDELKKANKQSRFNPQPHYYTNRGSYKNDPTIKTYQTVYNGATRSKVDSTTLPSENQFHTRLANGESTQSPYVINNTKFPTDTSSDITDLHARLQTTDSEFFFSRLPDDISTNVENFESKTVDEQVIDQNIEQPELVDTHDNEDDE